jgi:hypothetical protein
MIFNTEKAYWEKCLDEDLPLNASGYNCRRHPISGHDYAKFVTIDCFTAIGEHILTFDLK